MEKWWNNRYRNEEFIWDKVPSKSAETSLGFLKNQGIKKILDLPCGYGRDSIFLSKNGFDVTGVDRSAEALKIGRSWAETEDLKINFSNGEATKLKFPDNYFDAIVSNRFLHLVYDENTQKKVSLEMHRVLRDGGYLILSTRSKKDPDCIDKNRVGKNLHEIKDRPGHKIRFNTLHELKNIFSHFKDFSHETLEEIEAFDRQINCHLLKIIAKK